MQPQPTIFVHISGPAAQITAAQTAIGAAGFIGRELSDRGSPDEAWLAAEIVVTAPSRPGELENQARQRVEAALASCGSDFRVREFGTAMARADPVEPQTRTQAQL